jgi:CRISPR-associated protein Csm4
MPIVTLRPRGPFHVGQSIGNEQQKVYGHVPSDTLFGALVTVWAQMGRADEIVAAFANQPPFTVSSVFPCLLDQRDPARVLVRLAPLPMVKLPDDTLLKPKDKKRIRLVSWGVLERLRAALPLDDQVTPENLVQGKTVWMLKEERAAVEQAWGRSADAQPWWATRVVPRVTVDRVTSASNLFHSGRVDMAEGVGLWFAIQCEPDQAEYMLPIRSALDVLADIGLGGLRSIGHGAFDWRWHDGDETSESPPAPQAGYAVTLARYAPRGESEASRTLQIKGASYQLVNVPGWCLDDELHPWRRKRVRMVVEGSVLGHDGGYAGHLVDVKPTGAPQARFGQRGVYRYGYAFPLIVQREALREAPDE